MKDEIKLLISAWYRAEESYIYERSTDIESDIKTLNQKRQEWERRLGVTVEPCRNTYAAVLERKKKKS